MKNIILTLALFVAFAATAFAQYGIPSGQNTPVSGNVNITSEVLFKAINIEPESANIGIPGIFPGDNIPLDVEDYKVSFEITSAKGYGLLVKLTVNQTSDNGMHIIPQFRWGINWDFLSAWEDLPAAGYEQSIPGSVMVDGTAVVLAGVRNISADAGAYVGPRSFTITATAEYE